MMSGRVLLKKRCHFELLALALCDSGETRLPSHGGQESPEQNVALSTTTV
jgi:hypothetical protein